MKVYTVNTGAAVRFKCDIASPSPLWHPSRDEWDTFYLLQDLEGKQFLAFEPGIIERGFEGMVYLHIGKQDKCRSEVLAIHPKYLTDRNGPEIVDHPPPIEETTSGWWKEEGLEVVRLKVQGFTDGFMAFTKYRTAFPHVKWSELTPEQQQEKQEEYNGMQTYDQYLETMKAYNFCPSTFNGWKNSQMKLHGFYKD